MDLFTLGAVATKINAALDCGNRGIEIPENMDDAALDDALFEIQGAVETLSSVLLQAFREREKVEIDIEGISVGLAKDTYTKLQKIKHEDETDAEALIRLMEAEISRIGKAA